MILFTRSSWLPKLTLWGLQLVWPQITRFGNHQHKASQLQCTHCFEIWRTTDGDIRLLGHHQLAYFRTTKQPTQSIKAAQTKAKGHKSRRWVPNAPNTTPTAGVLAQIICSTTTLTQAAQEKTTASLSITDNQAGHVGHAGMGLKQVHDISGAKVSVSPTITANCCLITIQGIDHEVSDALTAIRKRLSQCCLHSSKKKSKKDKAPSPGLKVFTSAPPPPIVKFVPSTCYAVGVWNIAEQSQKVACDCGKRSDS